LREFVAICVIVFIVLGFITGLCMIIGYFDSRAMLAEFKSVQITVENARSNLNITPVELAALQQKIIDSNKWLAHIQYYDHFFLIHLVLPKELRTLRGIK
jgi:hypothetical protein